MLWKVHKLLLSEAYNHPFFQKNKNKFRAGHKLEAAIKEFGIICDGKIALDSGLSTGGFTDCLLQHVYGVDVGYGQVIIPSLKLSSSFQFICQFEEVATHCSTMTLKSHCALLRFRWLKNSVHMNMSQWSNVQIWDIFLNCHNQLIWWHWTCHLSQFSWYVWCALYYHSYLAGRRLSTRITFL